MPPFSSSWSWVPHSVITPSEMEMMRLALRMVLSRWAMIRVVRPRARLSKARWILASVTEAKIQKAFDALAKGRTPLIIAHRLSTIRQAGRIISIADGIITESGSHEELMKAGGMYSQLYTTQTNIARQM